MSLHCEYAGWDRRSWVLAGHVAGTLLLDVMMAWIVVGPELGFRVTYQNSSLAGLILAAAWIPVFVIDLREPTRGPACELDAAQFECGWILGSGELELVTSRGDLLIAGADRELATKWLDDTGLSRTLVMRLDDGMLFWISQAGFTAVGALGAVAAVLAICFRWNLAVAASALTLMFAIQIVLTRRSARATIVVDPNGVRIRRFARGTQLIPWASVRLVDDGDGPEAAPHEKVLVLSIDNTTVRLPHRLSGQRLKVLLERLRSASQR